MTKPRRPGGLRQVVERVRETVPPPVGTVDSEVTPERVMFLSTLDRDAERRPDDVRPQAGAHSEFAPPALLVDERLADVDEDRLQPHRRALRPLRCLALY
jgi:hypothetical protein